MTKVLVVLGTRPEQIKFRPVLDALEKRDVETEVFFTNQSPDLVENLLDEIPEDHEAYAMGGRWANLNDGIQRVMFELQHRLRKEDVDAVLVQGDTASAFAGALAAFLADVPVGHVEAGLRTYRRTPWPEEAFRGMIARMARWHFAPDEKSALNVSNELTPFGLDVSEFEKVGVFITGNPIIDTLPNQPFRVLVTLHRRENWNKPISNALCALKDFQRQNGVVIDIVKHPNWDAQKLCMPDENEKFGYGDPVSHDEFLEWMQISDVVVTDSGGLQEEAAHFGVDCIVYREATERTSLADAGAVQVVDPSEPDSLRSALREAHRKRFCYGDGSAGEQIADILVRELSERRKTPERAQELARSAEAMMADGEIDDVY